MKSKKLLFTLGIIIMLFSTVTTKAMDNKDSHSRDALLAKIMSKIDETRVGPMELPAIDPILNPAEDNWLNREIAKVIFKDEDKFKFLTQEDFNSITELSCGISNNNIPDGCLPSQIGNLVNLKKLSIISSKYSSLIKTAYDDEDLEVDGLGINMCKDCNEIFNESQLKRLYFVEGIDLEESVLRLLINNKNLKLPKEISNLTHLTHLHLEGFISDEENLKEIGNLTNLEVLLLLNNKIHKLPKEMGNLSNLKILKIYDFVDVQLTNGLDNLKNLKYLQIGYKCKNPLKWSSTFPKVNFIFNGIA